MDADVTSLVVRRYLTAKAHHERALEELKRARTELTVLLVARRRAGERAKDIAAELGLTAALVTRFLTESDEWQAELTARDKAARAKDDEEREARMARYRAIVERADAGADMSVLASEFGMSERKVKKALERARWSLRSWETGAWSYDGVTT